MIIEANNYQFLLTYWPADEILLIIRSAWIEGSDKSL